ncbi:MAG: diacylglycerol kinase family protein [Gemmatimonadaceae bacterium]
MARRCCVIANPASGGGRGGKLIPAVREAFAAAGVTDIRITTRPGEERVLARTAAAEGIDTIVALGGDGTWGNAAGGILESGCDARLAMVAAGTGNDFAFATNVPAREVQRAAAIAVGDHERRVDVGRVNGTIFLNVCGFGFDSAVLATSHSRTWISGHPRYLITAAQKLFTYRGTHAAHALDGAEPGEPERLLLLTISNGPRFGGGFLIAPQAVVDDGAFDVVVVRDASPVRRMALFAGATKGTHVRAPEVRVYRSAKVRLRFAVAPWFDADGELHQSSTPELAIDCLPARLRLAVPLPTNQ